MVLREIIGSIHVLPVFSIFCFGAAVGIGVCILAELCSRRLGKSKKGGRHERR